MIALFNRVAEPTSAVVNCSSTPYCSLKGDILIHVLVYIAKAIVLIRCRDSSNQVCFQIYARSAEFFIATHRSGVQPFY